MGKEKGGGKAKGKKAATGAAAASAYDASPPALAAFGLKPGELVRTPLGMSGRVLGVRPGGGGGGVGVAAARNSSGDEGGGGGGARVWVRYGNGHEAPLEPRSGGAASAGGLAQLGYRACPEAHAIRAAIERQEAEAARAEEARAAADEVRRLLAAGEPVPDRLLPPALRSTAAAEGGKAAGGGKGDKKKKKK